jgi:hypothetical protein
VGVCRIASCYRFSEPPFVMHIRRGPGSAQATEDWDHEAVDLGGGRQFELILQQIEVE